MSRARTLVDGRVMGWSECDQMITTICLDAGASDVGRRPRDA